MATNSTKYRWKEGAKLDDHTKKKHEILGEYFRQYLITRCKIAQQERFRLAVVDGFCGGGLYQCGSYGSPIIFINGLVTTANEINIRRAGLGMKPVAIECLLLLNDMEQETIEEVQRNAAPHIAAAQESAPLLRLKVEYFCQPFELAYHTFKQRLLREKVGNVIFNLDPCGYKHVTTRTIIDIMQSWRKAEILLTFMIQTILTYLSQDSEKSRVPLEPAVQEQINAIQEDQGLLHKKEWLGVAEKIVFQYLRGCASFVSPFSIKNPDGWQYWLMHFSNFYRARQVYNNILHADQQTQAHYGRSGLNMLAYTADSRDAQLYLFDNNSREYAVDALHSDIPRFISDAGDSLTVADFYRAAYSETPAHSDDINRVIIDSPDIDVFTKSGGKRRQASSIQIDDTLKLKPQRSFHFGTHR